MPQQAVLEPDDQPSQLGAQDSKSNLRWVNGGLINRKDLEILSGVQPGDRVIGFSQNRMNVATPVGIVPN
jgi:hypothetical protein